MKKTTAEHDPAAAAKLREIMNEIGVAMVTTVMVEGELRCRPMITREITEDGEIWFFTSVDSPQAEDLAEEHAVNVSYSDRHARHYVSVSGSASLVEDRERMRKLWSPALAPYFPGGLDDEQLRLLCVRVEVAELWDESSGKMLTARERGKAPPKSTGEGDAEHIQIEIRATPASG